MKEHLINQIKEILGTTVEEVINVDSYLKNKSEQELKEMLEIIIMEGKEDYIVFADDTEDAWLMYVNDEDKEVYL